MKAFHIRFEGWREAAQKVDRWLRRVEEGAEVLMRKKMHVWGGGNGRAAKDDFQRGSNR